MMIDFLLMMIDMIFNLRNVHNQIRNKKSEKWTLDFTFEFYVSRCITNVIRSKKWENTFLKKRWKFTNSKYLLFTIFSIIATNRVEFKEKNIFDTSFSYIDWYIRFNGLILQKVILIHMMYRPLLILMYVEFWSVIANDHEIIACKTCCCHASLQISSKNKVNLDKRKNLDWHSTPISSQCEAWLKTMTNKEQNWLYPDRACPCCSIFWNYSFFYSSSTFAGLQRLDSWRLNEGSFHTHTPILCAWQM